MDNFCSISPVFLLITGSYRVQWYLQYEHVIIVFYREMERSYRVWGNKAQWPGIVHIHYITNYKTIEYLTQNSY